MNGLQGAAPDIGGMVRMILVVVVVLIAWPLLLAAAILRRPILAVPVIGFTGLVVLVGMHDAQALAIYLLLGLWIWRRAHRDSFERFVGRRVRSSWVRWRVYQRRWRSTMAMSGLTKRYRLREHTPRLQRVVSTPWCDRVYVRLLLGQCTEDFERAAPELAHSFGARSCRVREQRPARLWLEFTTSDPLIETVPPLAVPDTVDLR